MEDIVYKYLQLLIHYQTVINKITDISLYSCFVIVRNQRDYHQASDNHWQTPHCMQPVKLLENNDFNGEPDNQPTKCQNGQDPSIAIL